MIAQHLLMRCKKGYYDSSALAGLKTAAVSDGFKEYSREFQKDIEQEIALATLPDSVNLSKDANRGILRISYIDDVSIVSRIFRVADKCDRRGNSNLTHTYIIDEDDRETLLSSPLCLLNLQAFDNYEDIDSRCGGLINGGKIEINGALDLFSKNKTEENNIFDTLNITKELFSKMITEVCNVLSDDGYVSVLIPDVDEKTWDAEGGSYKGEVFMLSIIHLLPSCLSRFFSGISYWNESDGYYGLDEIKFRVSSGRLLNTSSQADNSVIDFINHSTCPELETSEFGNYLWEIRNNIKEINRFRLFIDDVFGENVDSVSKPARLMDAVTLMYTNTDNSANITQHTISECLEMFGDDIVYFPKIVEYCLTGLSSLASSGVPISNELQDSMVSNINPKMTKLMNQCLLNAIVDGTANDAAVIFVKDILISRKEPQIEEIFIESINQAQTKGIVSISESMFKLIAAYYSAANINKELRDSIFILLCNSAIGYYKENLYSHYLDTIKVLSESIATYRIIDRSLLLEHYKAVMCKLIKIYFEDETCTESIKDILFSNLKLIKKFENGNELCTCFWLSIFNNDSINGIELCKNDLFFELFVIISPYLTPTENRNKWIELYKNLLKANYSRYCKSDEYLETMDVKHKRIGLLNNEFVRKTVSQKSNWKKINEIINLSSDNSEKFKVIFELIKGTDNLNETMSEMSSSEIIYAFILYSANKLCSVQEKKDYISFASRFIIKNENYLDGFIVAAKQNNFEKTLSETYYFLWKSKVYFSGIPSDEVVSMVYEQDKKLESFPYKKKIMSSYGEIFKNYFTQFNDLSPQAVRLINYGIKAFTWSSIYNIYPPIVNRLYIREVIDKVMYEKPISSTTIRELFSADKADCIKDMTQYIKRYIDSQTITMSSEISENVALLGLIYVMNIPRSESYAWGYLHTINVLKKDNLDWRAAESILLGLKYVCIIDKLNCLGGSKAEGIKSSFVNVFADNILKKTEWKKHILKCRNVYDDYIRQNLNYAQKDNLAVIAIATHDEELIEMFPREKRPHVSIVSKIVGVFQSKGTPPSEPVKRTRQSPKEKTHPKYGKRKK